MFQHFPDHCEQMDPVSGIETHRPEPMVHLVEGVNLPGFVDGTPFPMAQCFLMTESRVEINRDANPGLFTGMDDLPHQIELQPRINGADSGRIIAESEVAFCKDIDVFDFCLLESRGEFPTVKLRSDVVASRHRVKVKVNRPFRKVIGYCIHFKSCCWDCF